MSLDQESPFVQSDLFNKPIAEKSNKMPKKIDENKNMIFSFFNEKKAFVVKLIILLLVILIIYQVYCSYSDGFLQPSPKTGPEIDSKLDLEGEIALLNKIQESYFGKEC